MKTIFSITSDAFSLLKLKLLDEQFKSSDKYSYQVVYIGTPSDMEELISDLDYHQAPICVDVEPTTSAQLTARAFLECETLFSINEVDVILVPDASNAALASALVGIKKPIPVLHLEAGLRSHDRRQHLEINRKAIDSVSEIFFTTETLATNNLKEEGVDGKLVYEVGNLLEEFFSLSEAKKYAEVKDEAHVLCYFSHPSNGNDPLLYKELASVLNDLAYLKEILLPLDERTQLSLAHQGVLTDLNPNIRIISPPSPKELLDLVKDAALVLTDDGTLQVLASALQKQSITFGKNTERHATIDFGTNHLVGTHLHEMRNLSVAILEGYKKKSKKKDLKASTEIKKVISMLI